MSSRAAAPTGPQENGSRVYFQAYIEKGITDPKKLRSIVKTQYSAVNDDWMETYRKQAEALKGYLGKSKGYNYSRGTVGSDIMHFVETIAARNCGASVKAWNPADIYMVKASKERAIKAKMQKITSVTDKKAALESLNSYMRQLLSQKDLLPISLKAIKKSTPTAVIEQANMGGSSASKHNITYVAGSVKCSFTLGFKEPYLFDTGEAAFDINADGTNIHGQHRNFQYSQPRGLVQTDLTPTGARGGAKIGKVSSGVLDKFLFENGLIRPSSPLKDPNIDSVGQWTESNIKYWNTFYETLSRSEIAKVAPVLGTPEVKDGKKVSQGFDNVIRAAIKFEKQEKNRSSAGKFSSKLIGLRWVKVWIDLSEKKKLDEWVATLYYGGKKENSVTNGPFIKIY
jgi:hypothetical protein